MSLREYRKKRDFSKTKEPNTGRASERPIFVVQEHWASHHHFDFRLEAFGTLKSWAVPKGPSTKVGDKRLAVEVEDHPIDYASFKGSIPKGEYGAGEVEIWDKGHWIPPKDLKTNLKKGHLEFELRGKKLKGQWLLQRTGKTSGRKSQWLLIKRHDKLQKKAVKKKSKPDPWPEKIKPQLATLVKKVPHGGDWLHEVKLDGYRTLALIEGKSIRMLTRSGLDWTKKYEALKEELKKLKVKSAILDGEIVALDEKGRSDFSALQKALKTSGSSSLKYYIFDLLYLDGEDLSLQPLELRKQRLKKLLATSKAKSLIFNPHWRSQGEELFNEACKNGLEGIISKARNRPYYSGRNDDWLKIKCSLRQEFVIGGFTNPEGSRMGFGALLMGTFEDKKFKYVGRVGTGFDSQMLPMIYKKLKKIETKENPFEISAPKPSKNIHWVKPQLVAEVDFRAWTADGVLRQASFKGLRGDKKAKDIHLEKVSNKKSAKKTITKSSKIFSITHPERLIYPKKNITKLDVANYYKSVAPWLLKHTKGRPLSLVRCPESAEGTCFFQKHLDVEKMDEIQETMASAPGEKSQLANYILTSKGLLQLAQWGVLELHTWQTKKDHVEHPDQLIFDLDPGDGVQWKKVVGAAAQLKDLLERLELESFIKTTGGKGLHIHVPIAPIYGWAETKEFSKTVCKQLSAEHPGLFVTNMSKKLRKGKIFLDYLRNGFGATAIAPYSLRAKEVDAVAVPIEWKELKALKSSREFTIESTLKRLAKSKKDPWPKYYSLKQKIKILKAKD